MWQIRPGRGSPEGGAVANPSRGEVRQRGALWQTRPGRGPPDEGDVANPSRALDAEDGTIIAGAGCGRVPLHDSETMADLCVTLNATAILVVGIRLGCINHALLSLAAIESSGVKLAGWFGNCLEPEMPALQENLATLRERIDTPCLGTIPHLDPCNAKTAAQHIDLQLLLDATQ